MTSITSNYFVREWAPGHSNIIYNLQYSDKTRTGDVSGKDYLRLFRAMRQLDTFNGWMGDDSFACSPLALDSSDVDVGDRDTGVFEEEEEAGIFADAMHL